MVVPVVYEGTVPVDFFLLETVPVSLTRVVTICACTVALTVQGCALGGMHNTRLARRVQDWALGARWRETLGPSSARLVFDPTLRDQPGAGATVRQLRDLFTAECNLKVPPGAQWFAEGIARAGAMAIPRLDKTSKHAQLKYEEWDNATEHIVTRFCCTIPTQPNSK